MPARTQVDFLAAKALSAEEQETARKHGERMAALTRRVPFQNGEGEPAVLQLFFRNTYKTNGGHMFDITVRRAGLDMLRTGPCEFVAPLTLASSQLMRPVSIMAALQQRCGVACAACRSRPTVLMCPVC